ncbi:DciA family protein [Microbacterium sp.]|uniref:DciA family protein n=1 Tax=Microbacterium sp. TaxID=51671 RepID=UPI003A8E6815
MLTVKCDSTAWAKNLQFMRAVIMTEIGSRYPDAGVENLRFIGPDVPSWKGTASCPDAVHVTPTGRSS